jgi:hypothetical protein
MISRLMTSYEIALVLAIGAVIGATIFRTLIPITTKIMAEIQLSTKENRAPVIPKMHWIWWLGAGINIIFVGFPVFATIDQLVQPILNVTSPLVAFFIVWGLAQSAQEAIFRMMDSGVDGKDTKPVPVVMKSTTVSTPTIALESKKP